MKLHFITIKDGKRRVHWPLLTAFVALTYVLVIAAAEEFWVFLTGGYSPLIGLYALVVATLVVIRVVGASLVKPMNLLRAELRS